MRNITTQETDTYRAICIPIGQRDVVRFKISCDLFSKETIAHPSLLSQYTELLLAGTRTQSREQLEHALEALGVRLTINCGDAHTVTVSVTTLTKNLDRTLTLLHSILTESKFAQKEITRVQRQAAQAFQEELDDADVRAYAAFSQILFPKQHSNYVSQPSVQQRDLKHTDRADIASLDQQFRRRVWCVSVAADEASTDAVLRAIDRMHAGRDARRCAEPEPHQAAAESEYISIPSKENIELCIGNVLPFTQADERYLPFVFGLNVLAKAGGFAGRLMNTVRERDGLTYMIYGRTRGVTVHTPGCWYIDTFFSPTDFKKGVRATRREIERIVTNGITKEELTRFTALLSNQFTIAHESSVRTINLYHRALLAGRTAEEVRAEYAALTKLNVREVNNALKAAIDPRKLVIAGAGPVDNR